MNLSPETSLTPSGEAQPVLVARNLSVTFPDSNGGLHALEQITFAVSAQEFVCVLGPSGSGKSTLLRVLAGLLPATRGEVLFKGQPLRGPQLGVGLVFQKANLMPWRNVLENITLPLEVGENAGKISREEMRARAQEMVDLVGLQGFERTLPRDLSGGMAQRLAIARALVFDPDVLLLDEPFGALDALTRDRMGTELLNIWQAKRKTVVMVTHSIPEAVYLSDRVLVLSQRPGRVRLDLPIPLPRPREDAVRYTPEFSDLSRRLREAIE